METGEIVYREIFAQFVEENVNEGIWGFMSL